ncbi:MAG: Tyrosine recombinase XerC [Candidatus Heimdallarchaeota archaeon LC_2]|nr:MAG: Tyrosine recombinase XerC [Candidatus Heimdallarchaeota archaeon LC_2]
MISGGLPLISKTLTEEEIIERYIKSKATLSKVTLCNYQKLLLQFLRYCHNHGLKFFKTTETDVAGFISQFEYKSTKDSYKTILNIFYKWCFKHHLVDSNPVEDIVVNNGKKNKVELMREIDFKKILTKCEGLREITLVSMFWYTGVRAKELRSLRIQDIDMDRGLIFISNSKTTSGYRTLPIHPNFRKLLEKYLKRRIGIDTDLPWIFLTKRGTRFHDRTLVHFVTQLQKDLELRFTAHDFRRAFVTRLYRKTKDLVLCQRLAGHDSIKTTRRYIIDDMQEHMRKFNALNF